MKRKNKHSINFILIVLCLIGFLGAAVVAATQISLDAPATLPSDI